MATPTRDYRLQAEVLRQVAQQVRQGSSPVMGLMLESHLVAGNQAIASDRSTLTYGQSITDACIDLATTQALLKELAEAVAELQAASLAPV